MAQLYSNENFPRQVVEKLRELQHNVLTIQETGKADQALPDKDVLLFARDNNRALLTQIVAISFGFTMRTPTMLESSFALSIPISLSRRQKSTRL
jgi:hypothetical protein